MKLGTVINIIKNRKKVVIGILASVLMIAIGWVSYYVYEHVYYVAADDAKVTADVIKVGSQIQGKVLQFNVNEGDLVSKDEILARQDMGNLPDSSIEQSLIKSPIDGIVVKKEVNAGKVLSPGKTAALLADPENFYVTAKIDETKIRRLKVGQPVQITIDEYGSQKFQGKIKSIGEMTEDALNPTAYSTDGKHNRKVEKIPVKIVFDNSKKLKSQLTMGTNASVKICVVNENTKSK
ncbi:efflux RND transporter periplasmic adaptor subunit [Clostridium sp. 001]|uniref:efflux RND transporter periplasmic adaptor subunit n=1 Tax=Clostridium sp. 001 TaxID=1970093 RepID=UPI001C2BB3DB|nr:efflux RND transporter periplasmic adaptor subunit [Clostridium sp. 001]QXE17550.1 hemolysin D [Clostridium sp. 001]